MLGSRCITRLERREVADIARPIIGRRAGQLDEDRQLRRRDAIPEGPESRVVEVARVAMPREILGIIDALQAEAADGAVEFGQRLAAIRHRLVDLQERAELRRILALREGVVVVHRAVAAAGLEDAVIDARVASSARS